VAANHIGHTIASEVQINLIYHKNLNNKKNVDMTHDAKTHMKHNYDIEQLKLTMQNQHGKHIL
jgi:hypothetical protein